MISDPTGGVLTKAVASELVVKPTVSKLKTLRAARWIVCTFKRGRGPFRIPSGHTRIVAPAYATGTGEFYTPKNDRSAAREIETLLSSLGFASPSDWQTLEAEAPLSDADRRHNLILLCGSNVMWQEIANSHPQFLRTIEYRHSARRESRRFVWRNRLYHSSETHDFAVLAVKPNPFNPATVVTLLFGLRDIGTRGAARAFGAPEYDTLRKQIEHECTKKGELEILLKVLHDTDRQVVHGVSIATPADGEASWDASKLLPIHPDVAALNRIYVGLQQTPRPVLLSDFDWEVTYDASYTAHFRSRFTWAYGEADVVVQGLGLGGSEDLETVEGLNFRPKVVEGDGELIALPATNERQLKEFLLFPIPPIRQGDKARRYELTASWPRAGKKLGIAGAIEVASCYVFRHSAGPVDRVRFTVKFDIPNATFRVQNAFAATSKDSDSGVFGSHRPYVYEETAVAPGKVIAVRISRQSDP